MVDFLLLTSIITVSEPSNTTDTSGQIFLQIRRVVSQLRCPEVPLLAPWPLVGSLIDLEGDTPFRLVLLFGTSVNGFNKTLRQANAKK